MPYSYYHASEGFTVEVFNACYYLKRISAERSCQHGGQFVYSFAEFYFGQEHFVKIVY